MNQKIISNKRAVGNKKGGRIIVSALLLLAIFAIGATSLAVNVSAATSPSLGAASSFAVLGGAAVSDAIPYATHIIGDVGLSPTTGAAITGLTAVHVTGTIYAVDSAGPAGSVNNPTFVGNAQYDSHAAYGALSAAGNAPCTAPDWTGTTKDLVGLTLVPGVYCANVFQLSGTLTLDDTGAANGVWIFRALAAAAALTTSDGSPAIFPKVQFKTGVGSPCNVWWEVHSSATIGTYNQFIGNILALTSITLGTGASLNGRAQAYNGAVTLASNQVNAACVLPVTLTLSGTTTTITVTAIVSVISSSTSIAVVSVISSGTTLLTTILPLIAIIPEYPWGVLLLLILMLPVWMLLKRSNQNSISKRPSQNRT